MDPRRRRSTSVDHALATEAPATVSSAAGEQIEFTSLYRETFARVFAYATTLLRDRSLAEEVTAEAFERAYRKRGSYRPGRGSPQAWLFGIARNAALDELRRRRRQVALTGAETDRGGGDDQVELTLSRATVRAALAQLEPGERDLVALKFAGGLANAEIARVLGTSESNAGTRLHRTIEKLREACHDQPR
jgi:RNA polymerase sigma-70 factor (ECF subfamily)